MNRTTNTVVIAQMKNRERSRWTPVKRKRRTEKRLLRNTVIFAAVSLCLGTGTLYAVNHPEQTQAVMGHVTAGFEYDHTLGRIQFVSNILPESAMVFLQSSGDVQRVSMPTEATVSHPWTPDEPWMEYACFGEVRACCAGEIMTIVKNRSDEYTVRMLHEGGYESVYSGLQTVHFKEQDTVFAGERIGTADGLAAFELRKDGLSVQPVFAGI